MKRFTKPGVFAGARRPPRSIRLTLAADELAALMRAAKNLSDEKLRLFVQRLVAALSIRSGGSVQSAIQIALTGLRHDS